MNKHLQLPIEIEILHHPGQVVLRIVIGPEALRDWCLGFCLLKERLIETLTVTQEHGKKGVKVQLRAKPEVDGTVRASLKPDISRLEVTRSSLDYLQHFFLKYYRDGAAAVDHLDLEAIDIDTGDKQIYITLKVPDSVPPVSSKEAERRLQG